MASPKYRTPEEMQVAIDEYFRGCEGEPLKDGAGHQKYDKFGYPIYKDRHPPTVTGLALALGFTGRQALLNYQAKPRFVDTVTRAKARVEAYAEERLFDRDGSMGAKFSLANNFKGWSDTPTTDNSDALKAVADLMKAVTKDVKKRGG